MLMNERRCVITGLGLVSAIGHNTEECFNAALNGISGIKDVKSFDTSECYSHKGAEVDLTNEQLADGRYDRTTALGIRAAGEALADAKIDMESEDAAKIGVILGSCIAGAACVEKYYTQKSKGEEGDVNDLKSMPATVIAGNVADYYNCGGITANIVNACAAGTLSVALAIDLIRGGKGEIFLAGGCDSFSSLAFSGFHALRALDGNACSPFNHSEGITLGEGAGVLVVESYEHAVKRGAKIYCDVLGSGVSSDAYHITAPRPDGEGQMSVIRRAIKNSGLDFSDIDYINAHGTGTAKNDESEFLSLKTSFADNGHVSVSSTKSMTGHCLGAAGAIEAVLTVKALTERKLPPTTGYTEEDLKVLAEKSGNIDFIANTPRERSDVKYAMSNSFAFGGNNASIVFAKDPNKLNLLCPKQDLYVTGIGIVSGEFNEETKTYNVRLDTDTFKAYGVKSAFLRKLDRLSQLQLLSGVKALEDAGITVSEENEGIMGICIGTTDGPMTEIANFQKGIIRDGIDKGSAFAFPNTVYNAAGGYLSIFTGIKGYNVTIANGFQSGLQSVCAAAGAIMFGYESMMLASGTDECTDIDIEMYRDMGLTGRGMTLGEGSVTCVIEKDSCAAERGAKRYAKIGGFSSARDTSGDRSDNLRYSETALTKVIGNVLEEAGLKAEDISCIYGFGNGIERLDAFEMGVYKKIFGDNIEVKLVKQEFGEARAASSSLQLAKLAQDIYDGKFENGIAISCGTSALYSAMLLTKA